MWWWTTAVLLIAFVSGCQKDTDTPPEVRAPEPSATVVASSVPSAGASMSPSPSAQSSVSAGASASAAPAAPVQSALLQLGFKFTKLHRNKRLTWRQVEMLNWQASADGLDPLPPEQSRDADGCPTGMIRARGRYLVDEQGRDTNDRVFSLQNQACSKWRTRSHGIDGVCENFDAEKWKALRADLPTVAIDVCVDRYEFPNRYGEFPLVVTMFSESAKYCKAAGKRLCTESEWTFACEGEAGLPYPYGYERDSAKCNIDVMAPGAGGDTFKPRTTARTARGIDVAFRGKRSGASPECVSPLGAEDMTGNVDEWTRSVRGYGYKMILKGGHWGPARQRCRPQTRGHGPRYVRYDQGFRCCADAPKR